MGLAIEVGMLADLVVADEEGAEWLQEDLKNLNEVLAANGLPAHHEPMQLPRLSCRSAVLSFPYSFLHYLRRVYAHVAADPDWVATPLKQGDDPTADPAIDAESAMMSSHLLCHSDCEGFYVPVDFNEVLFDDRLPGQMLGSSFRLRDELIQIAPKLGIDLTGGQLTDPEADRINRIAEADGPFCIELMVWLALFEASRLSIEHQTLIVFT
ncbi:MAG: hypothetical protein GC159_18075 [Phycisphaera sp.]|nr:hypothetical protein [Phycisphaera sp.]